MSSKPIIALSTCSLSSRHTEGDEMLKQAASLGYEYVELSHGIRISLLPGILKAVKEGVIKVASCHNFCPLPPGINHAAPNLYQPTATDPRERNLWYNYTQRTIDFAAEMGAKKVILHGGSVNIFWEGALKKLLNYRYSRPAEQLATDTHYANLLRKTMAKLHKKAPAATEKLKESLMAIAPYAKEKGIQLGLENRDGLKELPIDQDFPSILELFAKDATIGYWHDSGHAEIKQQLGIIHHLGQVERFAPYLAGMHLKDARSDGVENLAIGHGEIDFKAISKYFKDDMVITIEMGPKVTPDELIESREAIERLL